MRKVQQWGSLDKKEPKSEEGFVDMDSMEDDEVDSEFSEVMDPKLLDENQKQTPTDFVTMDDDDDSDDEWGGYASNNQNQSNNNSNSSNDGFVIAGDESSNSGTVDISSFDDGVINMDEDDSSFENPSSDGDNNQENNQKKKKGGLFGHKKDKSEKKKKEKKPKKTKRGKKNDVSFSDGGGMVIMADDNPMSDNMVILEEEGQGKRKAFAIFKYAMLACLFFIGVFITYFVASYKLVPEDIKGTESEFMNLSVISRDYQVPLDEIRQDDILLISKTPDFSPLLYKYEYVKYQSHSGEIIFATSMDGLQKRLAKSDIAYILRGTPRKYQ